MQVKKYNKGFTLIELLVVVAIIGILASVVMASLNSARAKARDARRLSDLNQIQTALELYFNENGQYPAREYATTSSDSCGGNSSWCNLVLDLAPHISSILGDPLGRQDNFRYYYDSDLGDNYQTYGMMIGFESNGNFSKAGTDGGFFNNNGDYYEVGQQPGYCKSKYSGSDGNWNSSLDNNVCVGGN